MNSFEQRLEPKTGRAKNEAASFRLMPNVRNRSRRTSPRRTFPTSRQFEGQRQSETEMIGRSSFRKSARPVQRRDTPLSETAPGVSVRPGGLRGKAETAPESWDRFAPARPVAFRLVRIRR